MRGKDSLILKDPVNSEKKNHNSAFDDSFQFSICQESSMGTVLSKKKSEK